MKTSLLLISGSIVLLACPPPANAQFNYTNIAGTITITEYTGPGGAVTIPGTVDGLPVTQIGYEAFYFNSNVTSVTIPNGVVNIGTISFQGCVNLTNVTIPDTVTNLAEAAFEYSGLTSVTIPNSVTTIQAWEFSSCSNLTSVTIPYGVTSIEDYAFLNCMGLTNVTISDSVAEIGYAAFGECTSLSDITIPSSVTNIVYDAFSGCTGLTNCVIPDSITTIPSGMLGDCSNLSYVTIPNSVTSIGSRAFQGCGLTSLTIPDSVTSIGTEAFEGCAFTNVTVPASVMNFDVPFEGCSQLMTITVDPQNPYYESSNGVVFDKMGTTLVEYPGGLSGGYAIPNGVAEIGESAFAACALDDISFDDGLASIGNSAFTDCRNLTNAVIPNSVTEIGDGAFETCASLANISIPDSVTSIGTNAFEGCRSLTNIIIPESIGTLPRGMLYGCVNLADVTIPDSVTSIGGLAFAACTGLNNLIIPNSVTDIGINAFGSCWSLTNLYFTGDVPSVTLPLFTGFDGTTVYYMPGTAGWGSRFAGRPTVMLRPPALTITSPRSRQSVSNANFTVSATLTSDGPVTNVLFQLNDGGWTPATPDGSWNNWTASVTLMPGTNTVSAYATDLFGNVSATETVEFTYIVSAPLTVLTNGDGKVTPNHNNALLEIGKTYTMKAKPSKGFGFVNWTGSIVTNSPGLTFMMASNLTFTANFRDISRPVNVILSPKNNHLVTNAMVVGTGKAKDNVGVTAVWFRVNSGTWLAADLYGGTNWLTPNLSPSLVSGPNTLSAFALDAAGNASLTNTVRFQYAVP